MRHRQLPGQPKAYAPEQLAAANNAVAALSALDNAFKGRTLSDPLKYCRCCTDPDFIERLRTTPRDELNDNDMFAVVGSLTYTLGSIEDVHYFTPRFFADGMGLPPYDLEHAFKHVRQSRASWSVEEMQAVNLFMQRQLDFILSTFPEKNASVDSLTHTTIFLNCAAQMDLLAPSLSTIKSRHGMTVDARLLEFFETATWIDTYGSLSTDHYREFQTWVADPEIHERASALLSKIEDADSEGRSLRIKQGMMALQNGA